MNGLVMVSLPEALFEKTLVKKTFLGLFNKYTYKVTGSRGSMAFNKRYISHLSSKKDDFGNVYTIVHLDPNCDLAEFEGIYEINVALSVDETSKLINAAA